MHEQNQQRQRTPTLSLTTLRAKAGMSYRCAIRTCKVTLFLETNISYSEKCQVLTEFGSFVWEFIDLINSCR